MKKNNRYNKIILLMILMVLIFIPNKIEAIEYIICGDDKKFPYVIADLMSKFILIIKIAVPILFVISGAISFFKVVLSSSAEDDIKKAQKKLVNNIIAAIVIFFAISIVNFAVEFVAGMNNNAMSCVNCFINPENCNTEEIIDEELCPGFINEEGNCEALTNTNTNTNTNNNNTNTNTNNNNTNTNTNNNNTNTNTNNNNTNNNTNTNNNNTNNNIIFPDGYVVYFNPVTATKCNEQEYNNNSDKLGKSGCLKWYVFNDESRNETVNMILDHNTSETEWITLDDYKNLSLSSELGVSYSITDEEINGFSTAYGYKDTRRGPLTLLKKLKEDTNNWSTKLLRNDKYKFQFMSDNYDWYEINYAGYKARLMSVEEAFKIVKPVNDGHYDETINNSFDWLFLSKYWTSAGKKNDLFDGYYIGRETNDVIGGATLDSISGLRPVITVSKIDIRI